MRKLVQEERKLFKELIIKCTKHDGEKCSEQESVVEEVGEIIYENSISRTRQRKDSVTVNIGERIPEGNVRTSNIELRLSKEAMVELKLKYRPEDE